MIDNRTAPYAATVLRVSLVLKHALLGDGRYALANLCKARNLQGAYA